MTFFGKSCSRYRPGSLRFPITLQTAGGILLPESKVKSNEGEVLAIGPGAYTRDGQRIPPTLQQGDRVMLPEFGGHKVPVDEAEHEDDYVLFREEDILGKIDQQS